jgi:predicted ATP-grasp superfamily ATP-dependent carboligase
VLTDPSAGVDQFAAGLERLLRRQRHDVLLPSTDEALFVISSRRERLAAQLETDLPGHELVLRAQNKECLAVEGERVGLPPPEWRLCERLPDAVEAAGEFGYPVLVKGVRTVEEIAGRLVRHPTRLAGDEPALRQLQPRFGRCIVQRRVSGTVLSFGGVATDQGLLGEAVSRYQRTWPPQAGPASFVETVTPSEDMRQRVSALVMAIGWKGLFELELIECEDRVLRPIDFNPRPYGSMTVSQAAGAPLATLWCRWLLGEAPVPAAARPGVHYRMEDMDARHILWRLRKGDFRGAALAARPRRHTTHAWFRARDPLPLLARGLELGQVRWARREHDRA